MTDSPDNPLRVPFLPGSRWLAWLRHRPLRVGVLVGIYLTVLMVISLVLANRVPFLDDFAQIRNAASYALFALIAAIPVLLFRHSPAALFTAGITAWTLFSLTFALMGVIFENLFARLHKSPGQVFMLGAIVYGLLAVVVWVASMLSALRHHPVAAPRRRP